MLVGNKCDETESRELTTKDGEEQARKWSCHFMETSAKTAMNVNDIFLAIGNYCNVIIQVQHEHLVLF